VIVGGAVGVLCRDCHTTIVTAVIESAAVIATAARFCVFIIVILDQIWA